MSKVNLKGPGREVSVPREVYYSERYFSLRQLCSLSHQINLVMSLKPRRVLEIGMGNGFLSAVLRQSGVEVVTVDINPNLKPDIVSSISELTKNLKEKDFCLVVCAEVLEHLPFSEFDKSISIFRLYSNRLFLTLPQYKIWFGFSGWLRIPNKDFIMNLGFFRKNKKKLESSHVHFWELDQNKEVKVTKVINKLSKVFKRVEHGCFSLIRYHEYFICEDK